MLSAVVLGLERCRVGLAITGRSFNMNTLVRLQSHTYGGSISPSREE